MGSPNPNYGQWAATTIANYSKEIADNVTAHNALLTKLKLMKGLSITGGDPIVETLNWTANPNAGSYSGFDQLPIAADDGPTAAQYQLAMYASNVAFSGQDMLVNSGKEAILDLLDSKINNAENSLKNLMNVDMYLDGTGNNGKAITGLAAAVSASPTNVYGGIDRNVTANAFWKNKYSTATSLVGAAATSATIQAAWNQFVINLTRGTDQPNIIICSPAVYTIFENSLQPQQRFTDSEMANAGFRALKFHGIDVVFDTAASGIGANYAYFLNTNYLKFRTHKNRNFVALDKRQAVNQDATVQMLTWAGNLTCNGSMFQGLFNNV